jgi:hypothetical protein
MKPRLGAPTTATLRSSLAAFAMLACPPAFADDMPIPALWDVVPRR